MTHRRPAWAEFAEPDGPAEWRYNDWVRREVAERPGDKFAIKSLYRSDRLISAQFSFHDSVNVDATRWTLFSPDDLVSLGAAANACWRQFAGGKKRGDRLSPMPGPPNGRGSTATSTSACGPR